MISVNSISRSLPSRKNEDAFKTEKKDNSLIAVVADGMGGLCAGELASRLVSDTVCSAIIESLVGNPVDSLRRAFEEADTALGEESRKIHCRMGAAVTAMSVSEKACYVAWQGNVRLYLKRNDSVVQLTKDHTVDVGYGKKCLTRCLKGCGLREDFEREINSLIPDDDMTVVAVWL